MKEPDPQDAIPSRDAAEASVAIVTFLTLELTDQVNQQNVKLALAQDHDEVITGLKARIAFQEKRLEVWAKENRELFGESQSLVMRQGTLVFRWSNRVVALVEGWTWEKVLERLLGKTWAAALDKLLSKGFRRYLRIKPEINKQLIASDAKPEVGRLSKAQLKRLGMVLERTEQFSVEPSIEDVTP